MGRKFYIPVVTVCKNNSDQINRMFESVMTKCGVKFKPYYVVLDNSDPGNPFQLKKKLKRSVKPLIVLDNTQSMLINYVELMTSSLVKIPVPAFKRDYTIQWLIDNLNSLTGELKAQEFMFIDPAVELKNPIDFIDKNRAYPIISDLVQDPKTGKSTLLGLIQYFSSTTFRTYRMRYFDYTPDNPIFTENYKSGDFAVSQLVHEEVPFRRIQSSYYVYLPDGLNAVSELTQRAAASPAAVPGVAPAAEPLPPDTTTTGKGPEIKQTETAQQPQLQTPADTLSGVTPDSQTLGDQNSPTGAVITTTPDADTTPAANTAPAADTANTDTVPEVIVQPEVQIPEQIPATVYIADSGTEPAAKTDTTANSDTTADADTDTNADPAPTASADSIPEQFKPLMEIKAAEITENTDNVPVILDYTVETTGTETPATETTVESTVTSVTETTAIETRTETHIYSCTDTPAADTDADSNVTPDLISAASLLAGSEKIIDNTVATEIVQAPVPEPQTQHKPSGTTAAVINDTPKVIKDTSDAPAKTDNHEAPVSDTGADTGSDTTAAAGADAPRMDQRAKDNNKTVKKKKADNPPDPLSEPRGNNSDAATADSTVQTTAKATVQNTTAKDANINCPRIDTAVNDAAGTAEKVTDTGTAIVPPDRPRADISQENKTEPAGQEKKELPDVLYVLGKGSIWHDNEIKYSLRSLQLNGRNYGRIFIAAARLPDFIDPKKVTLVPCNDDPNKNGWLNVFNKVVKVLRTTDISSKFVFMMDDVFLTKTSDFLNYPYFVKGELKPDYGSPKKWLVSKAKTYHLLAKKNLPALDFDLHAPIVYDKKLYLESAAEIQACVNDNIFPQPRSYYCNRFNVAWVRAEDLKLKRRHLPNGRASVKQAIGNLPFFSVSDEGLVLGAAKYLKDWLKNPSYWEVGSAAVRPCFLR